VVRPTAENVDEVALQGYCVPLIQSGDCVAKLNFYLPSGRSLSGREINIFNSCASDITMGLATAQMRKVQADLLIEQARYVQRREISRNLHDTLGQKLIYLRFKLDQLVNDNEKRPVADIRSDLKQMLAVANESCELVRGTLAVLNSSELPYLLKLLVEQSRLIVNRNQWEIAFDETGSPQTLLPETLQQILYIFGEALSNIERHAEAQKVSVELIWNETRLIIEIADNGRGFEQAATQKEGHYGLRFMRERVALLEGHMDLHSCPAEGMRLTIELPINNNEGTSPPADLHETEVALDVGLTLFS
jgi:signal transduction histidine kinase